MRLAKMVPLGLAAAIAAACGSSGSSSSGGDGGGGSSSGGSSGSSGGSSSGSSSGSGGSSSGSSSGSGGGSSSGSSSGSSGGSSSGSSSGGGDSGACGSCPSGFSCSAAGYCKSASGVPAFDHVYVIMMENESQTDIQGSAQAPYVNGLLGRWGYTSNYSTTLHPSLPNYLEITSGSSHGVTCDCQPLGTACDSTCAFFTGNCNCHQGAAHLGDQLDAATVQWREYGQSMGTPCNGTTAAPYAAKHIPFLYYDDVYTNTSRCSQRIRDYADFAADLAAGTYRFSMISPNLCGDMHGDPSCPASPSPITQGDTWLSTEVPKMLASPGLSPGGKDVLFIVWDEQTGSTGGTNIPMLLIAVSPLVKQGATTTAYNHDSLLATIEDTFGTARLGGAVGAMPISDMWK